MLQTLEMEMMNISQMVDLLGRTELFATLDEPTRRRIAAGATQTTFAKGRTIFVQDEPGDRAAGNARGGPPRARGLLRPTPPSGGGGPPGVGPAHGGRPGRPPQPPTS